MGDRSMTSPARRTSCAVLVHLEVLEPQQVLVVEVGVRLDPPEHCTHPSDDLLEAERLRDVVVPAEREPVDLVLGGVARRQEQHADLAAVLADPSTDLPAVEVREHHVEHEQIRIELARQLQRLPSGACRAYVEPDEAQAGGQEVSDVGLVVDDEQSGLRGVSHCPYQRRDSWHRRSHRPGSPSSL